MDLVEPPRGNVVHRPGHVFDPSAGDDVGVGAQYVPQAAEQLVQGVERLGKTEPDQLVIGGWMADGSVLPRRRTGTAFPGLPGQWRAGQGVVWWGRSRCRCGGQGIKVLGRSRQGVESDRAGDSSEVAAVVGPRRDPVPGEWNQPRSVQHPDGVAPGRLRSRRVGVERDMYRILRINPW